MSGFGLEAGTGGGVAATAASAGMVGTGVGEIGVGGGIGGVVTGVDGIGAGDVRLGTSSPTTTIGGSGETAGAGCGLGSTFCFSSISFFSTFSTLSSLRDRVRE